MDYTILKLIHMTCAMFSYALFFIRGIWKFNESPRLAQRWVKVLPHINDTVLLLAGVGMALTVAAYPGMHAFLRAKFAGLIVYILLGLYAFRRATSKRSQFVGWVLAQLAFFYIVAVAITKSPLLVS